MVIIVIIGTHFVMGKLSNNLQLRQSKALQVRVFICYDSRFLRFHLRVVTTMFQHSSTFLVTVGRGRKNFNIEW